MPLNAAARNIRFRRLMLRAPRWLIVPAVLLLLALLWYIGAFAWGIALAGGALAAGAAWLWWRWAAAWRPLERPTLFVLRHRQRRVIQLLRAADTQLARELETLDDTMRCLPECAQAEAPVKTPPKQASP